MRIVALIPAAGRSRRMGQPKLLMPVGDRTVIRCLIEALRPSVQRVFVLIRWWDDALTTELQQIGGVDLLSVDYEPREMRDSVQHLLEEVQEELEGSPPDGWLLTPADHPIVAPGTLKQLIEGFIGHPNAVHLPVYGGKRGHPALFPWSLAGEVPKLPRNVGIKALLDRPELMVIEHETRDPSILWDLDTPEDYMRLLERLKAAHE